MNEKKFGTVINTMIQEEAKKLYTSEVCQVCVGAIYEEVCKALPNLILTTIVEHASTGSIPKIIKRFHD